jgi:hypothetical protein
MIKKWNQFSESVSGTTDTISFGPNFGPPKLPTTLSTKQTLSDKHGNFYTQDDYNQLYDDALKFHKNDFIRNGEDLVSLKQFTKQNLDFLIDFIK